MGNMGSFSPGSNPDTDRFAYYLGQIINPGGGIVIDSIESDNFFIGSGATDKAIYFNIGGVDSPNPGFRWNNSESGLEFSVGGTLWQPLRAVTTMDGSGISITGSADTVSISVDAGEIIEPLEGLKTESNRICLDFGSGSSQPARGNHTHSYALGDLSNVGNDTAASGNILSANGSSWDSVSPDDAGLVTLEGDQTISGAKGFSSASVSSYFDVLETSVPSGPPENTARIFAQDNGSGKTQLCVLFHTGDPIVIAQEV